VESNIQCIKSAEAAEKLKHMGLPELKDARTKLPPPPRTGASHNLSNA
jgi:hypothetical protein